jgi:anti-sigma B factor antagonist
VALSLHNRWVDDVAVVTCSGRIVEGDEVATLQRHVNHLASESLHVVLHLGGVEFVDSSGIGLLVRLLTRLRNSGGTLTICAASPKMREVLAVTRLQSILVPYESETEAIADVMRIRTASSGPLAGGAILCVEPSPDVLAYVREMLRSAGYAVVTAANIPDAMTLLIATRPKAIVISGTLRATRAALAFNERAGMLPVIELPQHFSTDDAASAGAELLDQVQALVPAAAPRAASAGSE